MTFFRDRADGPIHAVAFSVVEDGVAVATVKPIHFKGVLQAKLRRHIIYTVQTSNRSKQSLFEQV